MAFPVDTKSCFSMGLLKVSQKVLIMRASSGRGASYRVRDSPQSPVHGTIGDSMRLIRKLEKEIGCFRRCSYIITPLGINKLDFLTSGSTALQLDQESPASGKCKMCAAGTNVQQTRKCPQCHQTSLATQL